MPKIPIKSPTPSPKQNWIPLLVAGAVGFFAAFVLLKGCPLSMMSCPVYEKICPVTSTLNRLEGCLDKGNLASAKQCAEKLATLLEPSMPELARSAEAIADAKTIAEARGAFAALEAKLESGSMPAPKTP
ncbi:MAG: hypothetical protein EBT68_06120 [Verrucomicrobia bacterium]|nr:hypothetical protein [Verrucomicrobiota bacterium]NBR63885.1 hypothetical protein [Verrucomicrobiota bacterium]